ncbi:hypothetical protein pb186bvf_006223 [Paramecium bursaria]
MLAFVQVTVAAVIIIFYWVSYYHIDPVVPFGKLQSSTQGVVPFIQNTHRSAAILFELFVEYTPIANHYNGLQITPKYTFVESFVYLRVKLSYYITFVRFLSLYGARTTAFVSNNNNKINIMFQYQIRGHCKVSRDQRHSFLTLNRKEQRNDID